MKLTKTVKESIVDIVLNKTFEIRNIALEKEKTDIFMWIVKAVVPPGFSTSPNETWFPKIRCVSIYFKTYTLNFSGPDTSVPFYLLNSWMPSHSIEVSINDLPEHVINHISEYKSRIDKLKTDRSELRNKIRAIINSATTDKKLKEIWPEVETYWKFEEQTENLPAVVIKNINETIEKMARAE